MENYGTIHPVKPKQKLVFVNYSYMDHPQYHYFCPGCKQIHAVSETLHKFNQNVFSPTLQPSVLYSGTKTCHSFITDGVIQFLGDCFHELKSQSVELPTYENWPEELKKSYK